MVLEKTLSLLCFFFIGNELMSETRALEGGAKNLKRGREIEADSYSVMVCT